MLEKQNTLEWLDFIITIVLDSCESELNTLSIAQYQNITQKLIEKKQNYIYFFKQRRLSLSSRRKIQHLVKQHHGSLLSLLDQAAHAAARINPLNTLAADALHLTNACVYELLSFIQSSLGEYLDLDESTPEAYLAEFTRQHQGRISIAKQQLASKSADPKLVDILLDSLSITISSPMQPVSFRTIFYQRDLLNGLDQTLLGVPDAKIDQALIELLVYLNFNSRPFINYYTRNLAMRIDAIEPQKEKIHQLLLYHKQFNQMHRKPGVKLSSADSDVEKIISNWFTQEIDYLKQQSISDSYAIEPAEYAQHTAPPRPNKVMILLSVDQIGLFLRALDALRILKAPSLNAVFQSITPFLSTPRTVEISPQSMRSKSYAFEEKDKRTVIKILESVIAWIEEY